MTAPKISVLMSVLNGEAYLREAIESVLAQSFGDFEFVIVDNASTDRTPDIIRAAGDPRIVHIRNPETLNLSQSLNKGLGAARGDYVARLDADDIALPGRLEKQVRYLDARPSVALVASAAAEFSESSDLPGEMPLFPPADHGALMAALAQDSILAHSSIMFRREAVLAIGGYDEDYAYCMDYLLYFRLAERHQLAAIPEPLVAVRVHEDQITNRPEWEARRHREAASAFREILKQPDLPADQRAGLRRYLVLTSLRMASLALQTADPGKAFCWLARAVTAAPIRFPAIFLGALFRRVTRT